jgi:hypothetical protein
VPVAVAFHVTTDPPPPAHPSSSLVANPHADPAGPIHTVITVSPLAYPPYLSHVVKMYVTPAVTLTPYTMAPSGGYEPFTVCTVVDGTRRGLPEHTVALPSKYVPGSQVGGMVAGSVHAPEQQTLPTGQARSHAPQVVALVHKLAH